MKAYQPGDRVESVASGYFLGMKGTVKRKAQIQYNNQRDYIVELDNGERIRVKSNWIRPLTQEELEQERQERQEADPNDWTE